MASFRALSSLIVQANHSPSVTPPTGTADGDFLIALLQLNDSTITAAPTGWTLSSTNFDALGSGDRNGWVYTRTATASEPASYAWSSSGSNGYGYLIVLAYQDVAPQKLDTYAHGNSHAANPSTPTITPAVLETIVISVCLAAANLALPITLTQRYLATHPNFNVTGNGQALGIGDRTLAGAVATSDGFTGSAPVADGGGTLGAAHQLIMAIDGTRFVPQVWIY